MTGMSRTSGAPLDGLDHIRQSVADILTTRVGSRVGRRDYGSLLPDLIDQPLTRATVMRIYAATVVAIARNEDRLRLVKVGFSLGDDRRSATITIEAQQTDAPASTMLTRLTLPLMRNPRSTQ